MSTAQELIAATKVFLGRHWAFSNAPPIPAWSDAWAFHNSMPNHDRQGCYALFSKEELLYVGVGAGARRGVIYAGHGLGGRISNYIACTPPGVKQSGGAAYMPNVKWAERGLDSVRTWASLSSPDTDLSFS